MSSQVKDIMFPVPWGVIAAKAWGDPCAFPVIMLHGIQDNAGTFDNLLPHLPRHFYYVALDLPGHGLSSRFPKGRRLDFMDYLFSVNRVVRALKWTKFHIIGHSLGGQLGQYYTAMYPEQIVKLIVIDAYGPTSYTMEENMAIQKQWHEDVMKIEDKMLNTDPPGYTTEIALQKMVDSRRSFITKEAAAKLLPRNIKKGKNGYYFTADQRLKLSVSVPVTFQQHSMNYSNITSEFLLVITETLHDFVAGREEGSFFEIFEKNPLFKKVIIEGDHDVHSMNPERVAPIVSEFLLKIRSKL